MDKKKIFTIASVVLFLESIFFIIIAMYKSQLYMVIVWTSILLTIVFINFRGDRRKKNEIRDQRGTLPEI